LCEWFPKTPTHEVGSRANFHLYDVNVAATRIHEESMHRGPDSNDGLEGVIRASVVATGVHIGAANVTSTMRSTHPPSRPSL
jgi:hypothetical protein